MRSSKKFVKVSAVSESPLQSLLPDTYVPFAALFWWARPRISILCSVTAASVFRSEINLIIVVFITRAPWRRTQDDSQSLDNAEVSLRLAACARLRADGALHAGNFASTTAGCAFSVIAGGRWGRGARQHRQTRAGVAERAGRGER